MNYKKYVNSMSSTTFYFVDASLDARLVYRALHCAHVDFLLPWGQPMQSMQHCFSLPCGQGLHSAQLYFSLPCGQP